MSCVCLSSLRGPEWGSLGHTSMRGTDNTTLRLISSVGGDFNANELAHHDRQVNCSCVCEGGGEGGGGVWATWRLMLLFCSLGPAEVAGEYRCLETR